MASLILTGSANGVLKYTDDGDKLWIVISQISSYSRTGGRSLKIGTASRSLRLKLDDGPAVTAAIALLNSVF